MLILRNFFLVFVVDDQFYLLKNVEDGVIIINKTSLIEFVNDSALRIFGYKSEEIIGKPITMLMFEKDAKFHNIYVNNHLKYSTEGNLTKGRELYGKGKNNNKIPLFISIVKYTNTETKFIGFIRELKNQIVNELIDLKSIFLISDNYRVKISPHGKITNIIEFANLLGYNFTDGISDSLYSFVLFADLEKLKTIFSKIQANLEINNEVIRFLKKDQSEIFFSWNSTILPLSSEKKNENTYYQFTIANNVTDIIKKDHNLNLFKTAMKQNPTSILIADDKGNVEYVNDSFLRTLNLSLNDIILKIIFENKFFINLELKEDIHNVVERNGIWNGEFELKFLNNDIKTFFVTVKGIKNDQKNIINYIEMVEDITTLKEIYNKFELEREKLGRILDLIPEGILLIDKKGLIIHSNSAFYAINSVIYDASGNKLNESLVGLNLFSITQESILINTVKELLKEIGNNEKIIRKNSSIYVKILKIEILSGFLFIFYDISKEKRMDEFRNQIISMVSHELRTPISSITQSLYNYKNYKDKLNEENKERIIKIAYDNSQLLSEMVDDLLVISQLEGNKIFLNYTKIDVNSLIDDVIKQFDIRLQEKSIKITFKRSNNYIINCDIKRVAQIIRILIDNAIKYSFENSAIEINTKMINDQNKSILIEIKDYGLGISEDDQLYLFNIYFRGKNVSNIKGTGLGLSIAKKLIEMHKGSIRVFSNLNKGTSFQVHIPIDVSTNET